MTAQAPRLVLASRSPQRRDILERLEIEFVVAPQDVDELEEGDPERVVVENARRKALSALDGAPAQIFTLGVDTEVVLDDRIYGKARDESEARRYLTELSGRTHRVLSGVFLARAREEGAPAELIERSGVAETEVSFRDLDEDLIDLYIASGEWRERAGGYAIQGLGSCLIARIDGDFSNVVGLPVPLLLELAPELFGP